MKAIILLLVLACAWSSESFRTYDWIVVGAGTTGSVLCGRLVQAGGSVLCLEAGGDWEYNTTTKTLTQWGSYNYFIDRDPTRNNYAAIMQGGKGAGGSMYLTGNGWEQGQKYWWDKIQVLAQDSRYSYNNAQCYFDNIIVNALNTNTGKIQVRQSASSTVLANNWKTLGTNLGYPIQNDCNDPTSLANQFCFEPSSTRWSAGNNQSVGSRDTSWAEYVRPLLNNSRLEVVFGAKVNKVLLCNGCNGCDDGCPNGFVGARSKLGGGSGIYAYGVQAIINGTSYDIQSRYGVILSAGAINTPEILQLSGIGEPALLQSLGVRVKVPLPMVGKSLQDGGEVPITFTSNIPLSDFAAPNTGFTNTKLAAFISTPNAAPGEADLLLLGIVFRAGTSTTISTINFNIGTNQAIPSTGIPVPGSGELYLVTKDPLTATSAKYSYTDTSVKLNRFVSFYNITRSIMADLAATGGYTITETGPSVGKYSFADLSALVRSIPDNGGVTPSPHWGSTCSLGTNPSNSVVNSRLQVHGVDGLYVADNSVYPYYPGPGGATTAVFIGELLSQQLQARYYGNSLKYVYWACS